MAVSINEKATRKTRARYDRVAPFYNFMQGGSEKRMGPFRTLLWQRVTGPRVLEVGVGTGINMPFYPPQMHITAIDISPRMLARARDRASLDKVSVELMEADVQALPFPDASFDTVVTTCVFCSVPDPCLGLAELKRVLVPGGQLIMLEHVLSTRPVLRQVMQAVNPMVVRMMGANINRRTVENVERAGFVDLKVETLWLDIVKLIEARAPYPGPGD